ncbi:alpha/beta hydrolase fold domain-containing protein [Thalassotalea agarivorans]|uniref:Acetyl esterase/lipase n=1 Tax=Thalassotalea agarivorans TaxID=349064 RepID=A0A1I0GVD6_THASX|nr:alpha/beta hydrolase fold domain-containing protein [Thalassotalea agarivorans]SET75339.1 Acetyl esterase/lipase [Thalassotalea agarivorans]
MKHLSITFYIVCLTVLLSACSTPSNLSNDANKLGDTQSIQPDIVEQYKVIDGFTLNLHVFTPKNHSAQSNRPAIVFFHGGGWNAGHASHFFRQAKYLSERGMVAISADYRVANQHGTTPKESVKDAKSAMRYIRKNAKALGINPNMIAAGGGSAGGHLAAATATNTAFEHSTDDKTISYRPNLLVLFNPVFDNSADGYGHNRVSDYWHDFSPLHNIDEKTPAGIGFFGEKDTAVKAKAAIAFKQALSKYNTRFEVHIYKGEKHGFFNQSKYTETLMEMDKYLTQHNYLTALPNKVYYLDAKHGDDTRSGLSPEQAWSSLAKINQTYLMPGDKVLLKSGQHFNGTLEPIGSGTKSKPIHISSYGHGTKPVIHGWGQKLHSLLLHNVSHYHVSNLGVTNKGKNRQARRRGIIVDGYNAGELTGITLSKLEVYNVNGSLIKKQGGGSAILIRNGGDIYPTRYNGLTIANNYLHHSGRNGINFHGNAQRSKWYPNLNVQIKHNLIEQIPGDGIVVIASDGALIEGNVLRDFPDILPQGEAAAGIWPWSSDNTVIQFNEVSGHKAKWDGQGYDADFNSFGSVIQYNYSHDNYGGFLLVCNNGFKLGKDINKGTVDTIIRGNISINDGIRPYPTHKGMFSPIFHITGPTENTRIYDNIIIVPKKAANIDNTLIDMDDWGKQFPNDTFFTNNTIYFEEKLKVSHKNLKSFVFENNLLSNAIEGVDDTNKVLEKQAFDLQALKQKALEKLAEYKNNE